ncbi:c-type cytochrome [Pseudomonas hunanensis]|uniref:c-type cytochrome n=1 Tax=Pseudomonas hunanensis TaxID=1247546 RepID=UPI000CB46E27|nr:cytochrome c [Pseudomonas hunanensis]PKF22670.1 cytochrome C-555 [Pseudomonas hunanensis]
MTLKKLVLATAITLLPISVHAAGDAKAGEAKSASCAACHGNDGMAKIGMYPNLAGQNEKYLASSLQAYKAKQRSGGQAAIMQGMASNLSDQDIEDLAAYYASLGK